VQAEYEAALTRMDSLTGDNTNMKGELAERKTEIDKLKTEISSLLKDRRNLGAARAKIAELNSKISDLVAEVERLKEENGQLTTANQQLTTERDTLTAQKTMREQELAAAETERARVTDLASTLHISNINIAAIDVKGDKEKATDKAKKADLLRVSFQVDENRVATSGEKEFYVIVTGPDGKVVSIPAYGSGTFTTRDEGEKAYTSKVNVNYQQGQKTPASFDWKQDGKYAVGDYKIEVYQNGFKLAETTKTLKKSGFLGL
jgi:FtsZ-binding cell division protein ZapB